MGKMIKMEEEEQEIEFDVNIVMKKTFKDKIDWLSSNYDKEIAGFIFGEIKEDGIYLEDLLIPEQEAGGGSVTLQGKELVKLRKEYGDKCKKILGEWHSHNSMGAFWSSTDEDDFIKPFAKPRKVTLFIVSSEGKHLIRMEIRKPFFMSLDKLPYVVEEEEDNKLKKLLEKEIKKKVTEEVVTQSSVMGGYSGYGRTYGSSSGFPLFTKFKNNEKEAKQKLSGMWKFYNNGNILEIAELTEEQAGSLEENFKDLEPIIRGGEYYDYIVEFRFKNKEEAIDGMKEIRTFLIPILIAEEQGY